MPRTVSTEAGSHQNSTLERLQAQLAYTFENQQRLVEALTHRSALQSKDVVFNERLEFLGDAVLSLLISEALFERFPDYDEGQLSKHRARLVSAKHLSQLAERLGINESLILGRGEEMGGGRHKASLLANAFEAIVAAIYLDGGFAKTRQVVLPLFKAVLNADEETGDMRDFKTELQEIIQAEAKQTPNYVVVSEAGPDHAKTFEVAVQLDGATIGVGSGLTKKEASQEAARRALAVLSGAPSKEQY